MRRVALLSLLVLAGCGKEPPAPVIGKQAGSGTGANFPVEPAPVPVPAGPIDEAARLQSLARDCEKQFESADPLVRANAVRVIEACGEDGVALLRTGLMDRDPLVRVEAASVWTRVARDATEAISVLIEEISSPGGGLDLRITAIRAIADLGPRAHAAVPALVGALCLASGENTEAMDALAAIGDPALLPVIEAARRSPDSSARARALRLLSRMAPFNGDAVEVMREALMSPDPVLRAGGAAALGPAAADHDSIVDALAPFLSDPDGIVRAAAGGAMRQAGRRSLRAGEALVRALRDDLAGQPVATLLCELGPEAAPLLDPIRALLTDRDPSVAARAALALSAMGAAATAAIPDLMCAWEASMKSGSGSASRASLTGAIARMGDLAVVPVLDLLKGSPSRETKSGCLELLAELSMRSADAVGALADCLHDDLLRDEVVLLLARLGPFAWRSAADLIQAERLAKSDSSREQIFRAIGAIGVRDVANVHAVREMMPRAGNRATDLIESLVTAGPDGVLSLRRLLLFEPGAPDRRRLAVEVLSAMPGGVDGEVSVLTDLLSHADSETRRAAARALFTVRHLPPATIQALGNLLTDASPRVRRAAVVALARSGQSAAPVAARLRACESDTESEVRCLSLLALATSGSEPGAKDMILDTLLNDTRASSRASAARALARLASPGKDVVAALATALKDRESEVVTEALLALAILRADEKISDRELKRRDANTTADFGAAVVWACRNRNAGRAVRILIDSLRAGLPDSQEEIATSLLVQLGPGDPEARRELLALCAGDWPGRHSFRLALASRTR
ncbi:MAG: HEAT repeat domain-containing protein [Planctomycetota bacterium]